jgi:hypothetical protein
VVSLPYIVRTVRLKNIRPATYAAGIGEIRNAYKILVEKTWGNGVA